MKKLTKYLFLTFLFHIYFLTIQAQDSYFISPSNERLSEISKSVNQAGWVFIKDDFNFSVNNLLSDFEILGISKFDDFKLIQTKQIGNGIYLSRYQQF